MKTNMPANNVIQFPGKKAEDKAPVTPEAVTPSNSTPPPLPKKPRAKKSNAVMAGLVLAIAMGTGAVNRYAFNSSVNSSDMSSVASSANGRTIASVNHRSWNRDASWEKQLAERLAKPQNREIASLARLGHAASKEEKLRWGTLEEKYTILYRDEVHTINSISLQDPTATPSYVLDRAKFLQDFGYLMEDNFHSAKLTTVENKDGKTLEAYILMDKDQRPMGSARFELDQYKRLLSLKVEPI